MSVTTGGVAKTPQLSIERRLPLIIGALLLAVIVVLSTAAYLEMRATALEVAGERLTNVRSQFRDLFEQSAGLLRTQMAAVGAKPAVAAYARTRNERDRAAALAALQYAGPQPEQVIATELRDTSGRVLLSTAPGAGLDTLSTRDVLPNRSLETADSVVVGLFRSRHDTTVYATGARVSGAGSVYVVRWRRLVGSRRAREQLTRLVGSGATLMLGNPDGTQWTNLEHSVPAPPIDLRSPLPIQYYARGSGGERYLAAASAIPGTQWLLAIDFPVRGIMAPVRSFVWKIIGIAAVALIVGLLVTWIASRRLTRPIVEQLQHEVEERTGELKETVRQLNDAQESLVRREKLAMLGQLASGVGHELRNPLGVMTNSIYYLKAVLAESPTNVQEYLEILQKQVTLSEKIVSDLLDFSRSKPPKRQAASIEAITYAQVDRLGAMNGVRITAHFPKDLAPVLVDQTQIGQIILNLLTNATQAIDGNGVVSIRAERAGDRVLVDVEDSGSGVTPEHASKIFEPLFTTKARGIGLGLAVSRMLARANGGDLDLHAGAASGATFRLTLPVAGAL
jgi:signal transduction histidine kinase